MSRFTPTTRALLEQLTSAPRGPRRDALFALWLTVRIIEEPPSHAITPERAVKRRVALLEKRISSLMLPPALRRGLGAVLVTLKETDRIEPARLLSALAAAAREGVSTEAGDALSRGSRAARENLPSPAKRV